MWLPSDIAETSISPIKWIKSSNKYTPIVDREEKSHGVFSNLHPLSKQVKESQVITVRFSCSARLPGVESSVWLRKALHGNLSCFAASTPPRRCQILSRGTWGRNWA
ncbi:hypothetical protein TNCT_159271 [Trichonephila clavata]|uniref:Uncharacterized protein n=1 Tax=Trichonephila clavata TaxID=2740835 RepID=A0A8X6GYL3_TRICU|nr:hypothetical protein TNCT_159271 [Trichonephila clavata]